MSYQDFIASKAVRAQRSGFEVGPSTLPPALFDWQRQIVAWALRLGSAGLFEDCGLGKTPQQLAWAQAVYWQTGKDVLILAPLAVNRQTKAEGEKFGVEVHVCRSQEDVKSGVNIANYEMLKAFDPRHFAGVVLDESSILKNFMGKTKRMLMQAFAGTPYRLCCTATPAPNDHMELGNHADFLGIMKSTEMLTRWFINDGGQAGAYRLKGYATRDFWSWVASWAVAMSSPEDLGYPGDGYHLPPLTTVPHVVAADDTDFARGRLVNTDAISATTLHAELRKTADARAEVAANLANASTESWVIWCHTDYEADAIMARIRDAEEVRGSMPLARKERALEEFTAGNIRVLVTKPRIAGWGLNWQHVRNMVTVGPSYSFEAMYQAIRRCWRFGQDREVFHHVVMAPRESSIFNSVQTKEERHNTMATAIREVGHELAKSADRRELRSYHASRPVALPQFMNLERSYADAV